MATLDFFKKQNREEFKPRELPLKRRPGLAEKQSKGDWKWVLILLLATIILTLGFWASSRFSSGWQQFVSPTAEKATSHKITEAPKKETNFSDKKKQINDLVNGLQGTYGVYVVNLATKNAYGLNENQVFTAASLMKLPVILTLYQAVEKGNFDLESQYVLKEADKQSGAGSMRYKPAGTVYTYRQMAELMGQQSDNTAFFVLRKILGDQNIQATIDNLGMAQTSLTKNETSPAEMALFWRKFYAGGLISREHREEILGYLTKTVFEDRIPAGVPEGVRVAHKIGNEIGVFSDAGIVFGPKPFILVMMSEKALEGEAKGVLPKITAAVWEFETKP